MEPEHSVEEEEETQTVTAELDEELAEDVSELLNFYQAVLEGDTIIGEMSADELVDVINEISRTGAGILLALLTYIAGEQGN